MAAATMWRPCRAATDACNSNHVMANYHYYEALELGMAGIELHTRSTRVGHCPISLRRPCTSWFSLGGLGVVG